MKQLNNYTKDTNKMGIFENLYSSLIKKKDKVIRLSKLEILLETVDFYSKDTSRRSYSHGTCAYNGKNGTHCAFGRCLLPKYQEQGDNLANNTTGILEFVRGTKKKVDEVLQEKYRGHDSFFWRNIQRLHDETENWDASGITFEGEIAVNRIIESYNLKMK